MANLEIKLSANKRQPYLRHRVVGRVGDGGLTTINVQLLEEDEITPFVINLNGTLKFVGEVSNGNYTEGEPEIIDSTNGLISYTFTKSNFSTSHQFKQAYFEYVDPNGKKVTFQNFIIDVLERVDINSEQAKYYISSLEKLQSEMQTTFNQFISDKQVQYDQIYSKYNELVRLINESDKQANDRIDQTNQQIGDLGKLKKMYSNSIDFGNYDYSGNPNIAPVINDGNVFSLNNVVKLTPHGTFATSEKIADGDMAVGIGMVPWSRFDFSKLTVGKQYTLTIPIRINADYTGDISKLFIRIRCANTDSSVLVNTKMLPSDTPKEELVDISTTFTVPSTVQNSNNWYCQVGSSGDSDARGTVDIGYDVKLEEGSTATSYQPNLLDAPYYLSNKPLGENIANPTVKFPITLSNEALYAKNASEDFVLGETYTVTIKATKPVSQTIRVYLTQKQFGDFKPVEGLVDTWVATVSIKQLGENTKWVYLSQTPNTSLGPVKIDWLKIEKGDTRTPNISEYKYFGEGLKDSNNPNDYSWDITPEYTEKGLNDTVSLTEPETVLGLKNFIDGIQVDGKDVRTKYSLSWTKIAISGKATSNYFYVRRDGDIITFSGQLTIEPISSWSENIIGNLIEEFYVSVIPGLNTITWDAISEDGKTHALARITKDGKLAIMQTYGDVTTAKSYWITQSFPAAISFE
ncbi:BppU family phage baseplate upper protein [Enterococcus lactis]|uniref:BppU family phage baseplate upper protein n=2 Tax=Enterococcus TaxID=1350 RepID=UPI00288CC999|nr:BppU family phage baseplate upper protein [Enterococcus lactis]MDT2780128.1 BppU family phage baseplate upper protein [Enterococcus lactis]